MAIEESRYVERERIYRVVGFREEMRLSKLSLVRYMLLSLGLISKNESRQSLIKLFSLLLDALKEEKGLTIYEIVQKLKDVDEKTIYYHLKRLKEQGFVKKKDGEYFLIGFSSNFIEEIRTLYKEDLDKMLKGMEKAFNSYLNK